jgi:hypothetical protein
VIEQLQAMTRQVEEGIRLADATQRYERSGALRGLLGHLQDAQRAAFVVATMDAFNEPVRHQ